MSVMMCVNTRIIEDEELCLTLIHEGILKVDDVAVYISKEREVFLMDYEKSLSVIDCFADRCMSVMMGKTEYLLIFPLDSAVVIDGDDYVLGECLIMKSEDGVRCLSREELLSALREYTSRQRKVHLGQYCVEAYRMD